MVMMVIEEWQENFNVEKFDVLVYWFYMLEKSKGKMEMYEIYLVVFNVVVVGNEMVVMGLQVFVYYMI